MIRGQPQQFVERCSVLAILSAIDRYGISDIDGLLAVLNDNEQKADLRAAIGTATACFAPLREEPGCSFGIGVFYASTGAGHACRTPTNRIRQSRPNLTGYA